MYYVEFSNPAVFIESWNFKTNHLLAEVYN